MTSRIPECRSPDVAWSERERELLDAACNDRMPAQLEARLREALDMPPCSMAPNTSRPDTGARASFRDTANVRQLFAGKLPLWGVLSVLALGAVSYLALTRSAAERGVATKSYDAGAVRANRPSPPWPLPAAVLNTLEESLDPLPVTSDVPVATPAAHSRTRAAPDQLRIEAELLASVRRALGQGELARARQRLARYAMQFKHGALQPESDVLAIELKMRTGAKVAANAQAERFITQYPNHPLRDRVRQLVSAR